MKNAHILIEGVNSLRKLINVGYGNSINAAEVVAIINADSVPAKRTIKDAKESKYLIDATEGNKTYAAVIMKSGHVVISANKAETLKSRINE